MIQHIHFVHQKRLKLFNNSSYLCSSLVKFFISILFKSSVSNFFHKCIKYSSSKYRHNLICTTRLMKRYTSHIQLPNLFNHFCFFNHFTLNLRTRSIILCDESIILKKKKKITTASKLLNDSVLRSQLT